MTLAQSRALLPLLTKIGEVMKIYPLDLADHDHCSPGIHLTAREWLRILEEFGNS